MSGPTPPVVLSIAGSDSSGGAGIQADLRTFAALGIFGTSAITAVTAQNTLGVSGIDTLPAASVVRQVDSVLADLPVAAVKTGMLAEASIVDAVAALARSGRLPHLVVDPVMVASSGAVLASEEAIVTYRDILAPLAELVTPNLPEASVLAGTEPGSLDQERLARLLGERMATAVVVKGGHGGGSRAEDVLWFGGRTYCFSRPRIATMNTHGSGCTFSAAVAAYLALGHELVRAVEAAGDFVQRAIAGGAGWRLGGGPGPLDHLGWTAGARRYRHSSS